MEAIVSIDKPAARETLAVVRGITERQLAPLQPCFVAMRSSWTSAVAPGRALRSLILMALFKKRTPGEDAPALCAELALNVPFRDFLGMTADEAMDEAALGEAHGRLIKNVLARRFVADVVAAAQATGMTRDGRCDVDEPLVASWTC